LGVVCSGTLSAAWSVASELPFSVVLSTNQETSTGPTNNPDTEMMDHTLSLIQRLLTGLAAAMGKKNELGKPCTNPPTSQAVLDAKSTHVMSKIPVKEPPDMASNRQLIPSLPMAAAMSAQKRSATSGRVGNGSQRHAPRAFASLANITPLRKSTMAALTTNPTTTTMTTQRRSVNGAKKKKRSAKRSVGSNRAMVARRTLTTTIRISVDQRNTVAVRMMTKRTVMEAVTNAIQADTTVSIKAKNRAMVLVVVMAEVSLNTAVKSLAMVEVSPNTVVKSPLAMVGVGPNTVVKSLLAMAVRNPLAMVATAVATGALKEEGMGVVRKMKRTSMVAIAADANKAADMASRKVGRHDLSLQDDIIMIS